MLIHLLMLLLSPTAALSKTITCKAGSFSRGETASVTCYFHEDVGKSLYHVYVTLSPFDSSNEVIDTEVLVCFKQLGESRSCRKASGYDWDNEISSNLTMQIPAVQARFAGRYSCQLVPPDGLQSKPCDLHVEDDNGLSPELTRTNIILSVVCGILASILACSTMAAVYYYRTRLDKKVSSGMSEQPNQETDKEPLLDKFEETLEEIKNLVQKREPRYMYKELYLMDGAQVVVNPVNILNQSEVKTILTPDTDRREKTKKDTKKDSTPGLSASDAKRRFNESSM